MICIRLLIYFEEAPEALNAASLFRIYNFPKDSIHFYMMLPRFSILRVDFKPWFLQGFESIVHDAPKDLNTASWLENVILTRLWIHFDDAPKDLSTASSLKIVIST